MDPVSAHKLAMDLAERAELLRLRGEGGQARALLADAYGLERVAAEALRNEIDHEPSRSVLYRSAAALALDVGRFREAEQLVAAGLSGDPPQAIADELRDLLEQIHMQRHMETRGVVLYPEEFQVSLSGKGVGFGVVPTDTFLGRVRDLEALIFRTAERRRNKPYRERGRRSGKLQEEVDVFLSTPRAASFAVTFRLGTSNQLALEDTSFSQEVIDDLLKCLKQYSQADRQSLKESIPDPTYRRNFYALVRKIAPDGNDVSAIAFTASRNGSEVRVALTKDHTVVDEEEQPQAIASVRTKVRGTLRYASSLGQEHHIQVLTGDGRPIRVAVPEGLMDDVVRPYWDFEVEVTGVFKGAVLQMEQILPVTDE